MSLDRLPFDMINVISSYLNPDDFLELKKTCRLTYKLDYTFINTWTAISYNLDFDESTYGYSYQCQAINQKDCLQQLMNNGYNWLIRQYAYYYLPPSRPRIRKFIHSNKTLPQGVRILCDTSAGHAASHPIEALTTLKEHGIMFVPNTPLGNKYLENQPKIDNLKFKVKKFTYG